VAPEWQFVSHSLASRFFPSPEEQSRRELQKRGTPAKACGTQGGRWAEISPAKHLNKQKYDHEKRKKKKDAYEKPKPIRVNLDALRYCKNPSDLLPTR